MFVQRQNTRSKMELRTREYALLRCCSCSNGILPSQVVKHSTQQPLFVKRQNANVKKYMVRNRLSHLVFQLVCCCWCYCLVPCRLAFLCHKQKTHPIRFTVRTYQSAEKQSRIEHILCLCLQVNIWSQRILYDILFYIVHLFVCAIERMGM